MYCPFHAVKQLFRTGGSERKARRPTRPHGQGEVILLVEDNDRIRDLVQRFLELLDYRVLAVHEAEERDD